MEKIQIHEEMNKSVENKKRFKRQNLSTIIKQKTIETFPPTKYILNKSKEERSNLSNEKLKNISNREFLAISPVRRLENITKNNIKSEKVSDGTEKNLEFSFTFEGKFNKELYLKTTAGQVLPKEVSVVKKDKISYERNNLSGEFFANGNKRLIIKEGTQINIEKLRTPEEIKKIEEDNNKEVSKFKGSPDYKTGFDDVILEAIKRGVDPKFALLAFEERASKTKNIFERLVLIEEMFTQYDRKKGKMFGILNNSEEGLKVFMLRDFGGKKWKQKAEKLGISSDIIKNYESKHFASKLNLKTRAEIIANVPYYTRKAIENNFPASEVENAILVAHGESGFKLSAYRDSSKNPGGGNDLGLFQINDKYHPEVRSYNWKDPEINAKLAYKIYKHAGNSWKPWYAAKKIGLA